jgi:hypothetical protein
VEERIITSVIGEILRGLKVVRMLEAASRSLAKRGELVYVYRASEKAHTSGAKL